MHTFGLAKIFCDNMVLQRNKEIKIWGNCVKDNLITVGIASNTVTVKAINGKWMAVLPPMEATPSCEITVYSHDNLNAKIIVKNVAIGEVWVAGGQSNMEFPLRHDFEVAEVITSSNNNPDIRFFDCPRISYQGQEERNDFSEYGMWRICNAENLPFYSAVGYYFAAKIQESLKVPVGIIGCNWGGTSVAAWLDEKYLTGDLNVYIDEYERSIENLVLEDYEKKVEQLESFARDPLVREISERLNAGTISVDELKSLVPDPGKFAPVIGPKYFNRPAGLYHYMVEKIVGYPIKGVIWYQGEADAVKADIYSNAFSKVIECWRTAWNEEIPFLFVQLAPFGKWLSDSGKDYPIVRHQQEIVSKTVNQAYMVSIMDSGMEFDIHPKKKRPVGERLALLARGMVYGENILCEAPEVYFWEHENDKVMLKFNHCGTGLALKGDRINGLQMFVDEKEIDEFSAVVDGNVLCLKSHHIADRKNVEIRFAWLDYVEVNLYNSAQLPMKPFKLKV